MRYDTILYTVTDGVAAITLNRPKKLNAFNDLMIAEVIDAFSRAAADTAVGAILLTGNGRAFSAGQDLAAVQEAGDNFPIGEHLRNGYNRLIKQMVTIEKPIIAAINGIAAGAGCGIALAADMRIAADNAAFVLVFSRIGLIPDSGVNFLLPRLIGYGRAYEMAITAKHLPAATALEWGMVNRVVPHEQLMETAVAFAAKTADGATIAFGLTKRAMYKSWTQSLNESLETEADLQEIAGRTPYSLNAVQSFINNKVSSQ